MASYRFRRRLATLFLAAAAALAPARPPRAAISRSAAVAELPVQQTAKTDEGPIAVLLLNLGGPETSEDVEPFLYNLFADPDIIRLPPALAGLQTAIAWLVAKRRAPKSRAAYDSIGGGSPILEYTTQQASLLESRLGPDYKCYVAMRYWHPFTDDAVQKAVADGCTSAVVLPLYPHFSISTTGTAAASGVGPSHNHAVAARRITARRPSEGKGTVNSSFVQNLHMYIYTTSRTSDRRAKRALPLRQLLGGNFTEFSAPLWPEAAAPRRHRPRRDRELRVEEALLLQFGRDARRRVRRKLEPRKGGRYAQ